MREKSPTIHCLFLAVDVSVEQFLQISWQTASLEKTSDARALAWVNWCLINFGCHAYIWAAFPQCHRRPRQGWWFSINKWINIVMGQGEDGLAEQPGAQGQRPTMWVYIYTHAAKWEQVQIQMIRGAGRGARLKTPWHSQRCTTQQHMHVQNWQRHRLRSPSSGGGPLSHNIQISRTVERSLQCMIGAVSRLICSNW